MCCGGILARREKEVLHPPSVVFFFFWLFVVVSSDDCCCCEFVSLFLLLETNRELNAKVNSTRPPSFTYVRPFVSLFHCVCVYVVVSFNLVKLACVTQVKAVWSVSRITRNSSESLRVWRHSSKKKGRKIK